MINRLLSSLCLLFIFLSPSLHAQTYTYYHPTRFSAPANGTAYFDPISFCKAYYPSRQSECGGSVLSTNSDFSYQNWRVTLSGNTAISPTATASCAPDSGPGMYKNASGDNTMYCRSQVTDPCADKNPYLRNFYYTSPPFVAPDHYGVCVIVATEMVSCRTDAVGTYCYWKFQRTGVRYTGTDRQDNGSGASDKTERKDDPRVKSPPISNPPTPGCSNCVPCPAGTVQGGVDSTGIPICMGTGTAPDDPPKTPTTTTNPPVTTNNSDGSVTTIGTTTQKNADGTTTTTTTTTNTSSAGAVTKSVDVVTSTKSDGSAGKMDTPNTDQGNLCKQNPNLAICRDSTVTGDCSTGVSCTGDAVACANLQAVKALQCARAADEESLKNNAQKDLGDSILNGSDPEKGNIDKAMNGTTVDMSKTNLDQSGFIGGGACLPDRTFTFMSKTVNVSFSSICNKITPLRYVIMSCAFIVAYLFVARSVISGA